MRLVVVASFSSLVACAEPPGVSPDRGRVSGGDVIRIVGEGFRDHGAPVAYVGAKAAKAVTIESDRSIVLTTPEADGPGVVDVAVHFADGTVTELRGAFEYETRGVVVRAR